MECFVVWRRRKVSRVQHMYALGTVWERCGCAGTYPEARALCEAAVAGWVYCVRPDTLPPESWSPPAPGPVAEDREPGRLRLIR